MGNETVGAAGPFAASGRFGSATIAVAIARTGAAAAGATPGICAKANMTPAASVRRATIPVAARRARRRGTATAVIGAVSTLSAVVGTASGCAGPTADTSELSCRRTGDSGGRSVDPLPSRAAARPGHRRPGLFSSMRPMAMAS
jgi:hypothetical protein